jgi:signal transduction histidine kinase/CheY-like chemotaxis protein
VARSNGVNIILFVLILVLMITVTVAIIDSINSENTMNLVRAYSTEAAEILNSYINVMLDGKPLGLFGSGFEVPNLFHNIFGNNADQKVRGYIVDRHGTIQFDSIHPRALRFGYRARISEERTDTAFATAFKAYLGRIDDLSGGHLSPQIIKLSKGRYGYAAFAPIGNTDWLAVVVFNNSLWGTKNILALLATMLSALVLYMVSRHILVDKLIFTPFGLLTKDVSDGKAGDEDFFGTDRDDDIGDLSRVIQKTTLELKDALKAAQETNSAKSVFLANMSHEMRTPLNAIIGLSELTLDKEEAGTEAYTNLEKIYNAGLTLLYTVNDVLDISKIEAGKFELTPVEYFMPSLLNDTITQSIMHIGEKPIRFVLDIEENLPNCLYGDDLRVKQIFNNLLSNAFKFTKEGTVNFTIRCTRDGDTVWLTASVQDTGVGIRPNDIKIIFTNYAQMDTTVNREITGTGLGMPITKKVVEMMGGSITVESEYGKGSTFTVKIKQKYVDDDVIGFDVANGLMSFRYSEQRRKTNSQLVRIKIPNARILIVDDVSINLDVAKGMMKSYDMQIDCLTSGQAAIDAVREEKVRYNAIFMDHMMPEMDGIEATRIIREEIGSEYAKTVPIIALTANAIVGTEKMFLDKGFQAFVSKPIDLACLDAVIRKWVRDKKIIKESTIMKAVRGFPEQVDGINLQKGLERFGGNEESYLNVIRSYVDNMGPLLEKASKPERDKLADYSIVVHGIKGASLGICANLVGDKATALENAAKEGDFDFIIANNAALMEVVEKLITDLKKLLSKMIPDDTKPLRQKPEKEVLDRLKAACDAGDLDEADMAVAEIGRYEYESDDGLVEWLNEQILQMNFDLIAERLREI